MSPDELESFIGPDIRAVDLPEPSWNIRPTNQVPVLREDHKQPGVRRLESAQWSLAPIWAKTLRTKTPLFNARIETVLEKPSFQASVKIRRCVLPASGYYEWTGEKGSKTPHYIHRDEPIMFAGLLSWWREPNTSGDDGWHLTTTMLTMDSYGPMEAIHHRIPVFMTDELLADWLSPEITGDDALLDAVAETSKNVGTQLREHTVSSLKGEGPELIAPVSS